MRATLPDGLDAVRQPAYTGENRCTPCTILNLVIAAVLAVLVATVSVAAAIVALAGCVGAIWLRGYLVPGTPALTKRYLPARVHRLVGTDHETGPIPESTDGAETDLETLLFDLGVVTDCDGEDDLCLEAAFRTAWRERIDAVRTAGDGRERLARRMAVDAAYLRLESENGRYWLYYENDPVDAWPSRAAFLADLAAERNLRRWSDGWDALDEADRALVLTGLRAFLERCPRCDATLEATERTWETCCREGTAFSIACEACGDEVVSGQY